MHSCSSVGRVVTQQQGNCKHEEHPAAVLDCVYLFANQVGQPF